MQDPAGRDRLVTSAYSVGRVVTEIKLRIKKSNGEIVAFAAVAKNLDRHQQ